MEHLGENLKSYRNSRGWTQSQMANFLKIGYRTYQTIEKTGVVAKADDLKRIYEKTSVNTKNISHDSAPITLSFNENDFQKMVLVELRQLQATVNIVKLTVAKLAASKAGSEIESELDRLNTLIDREADRLMKKDKEKFG